jgi:FxsC-like protein
MQAAGAAKLHYEALPVGNDLIAKLKEAQQANKIVVIILDAWTLKIDRYQNLMDTYNQSRFRNCVVVVPWNQDEETREHADELEAALHATFFGHPDEAFRPRIISSELFHQELIAALNRCRGSILKYAEIRRRAQGTGRRSIPLISAVRA